MAKKALLAPASLPVFSSRLPSRDYPDIQRNELHADGRRNAAFPFHGSVVLFVYCWLSVLGARILIIALCVLLVLVQEETMGWTRKT